MKWKEVHEIINEKVEDDFVFFFEDLQSSFSLVKRPKIHVKLITAPTDIKVGGIIQMHCYIEGGKQSKSINTFFLFVYVRFLNK
jgi:hypothetical protein